MIDTSRPRALHNLKLRPGYVVELDAWEDGDTFLIGERFTINATVTLAIDRNGQNFSIPSTKPKGERPLFTIVSRATP